MGEVVKFEPKQEPEPYLELWECCPECGGNDGAIYITNDIWGRCDKHKTTFCLGTNCAYTFPNPDAAEHQTNADFLADYQVVGLDSEMTMRGYQPSWYVDPKGA